MQGLAPSESWPLDCVALLTRTAMIVVGAPNSSNSQRLREVAERAGCPVAGLYTYGEIARTSGSTGFHNLTVVLLAFG